MQDVVLVFHLIGLMMGAAGGMSNIVVMSAAAKATPEQAATLRSLGPALARLASAGLALMLLTGLGLVALTPGGPASLPSLFWVKAVFIATLTLAAIGIELTYAQVKKGDAKAAARLPLLGPAAGVSSLLAVTFAVLTFH